MIARDEWGFRTPKTKKTGGKPLSLSTIYRTLTNPFYAGVLEWGGDTYPGKHEPVVSMDEFERVQAILGRPGRPQAQKHSFAFTGMIRCGSCGLMVTAEHKVNRHGSRYVYYHCTKRNIDKRCPEPSVEVKKLEAQIVAFLETITISERYHRWVLDHLKNEQGDVEEQEEARKLSIQTALDETRKQITELTNIRLRGLLTDDEFTEKRKELKREQIKLEQRLAKPTDVTAFEPLEGLISFRNRAVDWFQCGDGQVQKLILETVGSNPALKDKKLSVEARRPFRQVGETVGSSCLRADVDNIRTLIMNDDEEMKLVMKNIQLLKQLISDQGLNHAA